MAAETPEIKGKLEFWSSGSWGCSSFTKQEVVLSHASEHWQCLFSKTSHTFPPPRPSLAPCSSHLQDVVALRVAEVAHSDLGAHVPAIERARGELQPSHLQQHAGHCRQCVPLQLQLLKPLVPAQQVVGVIICLSFPWKPEKPRKIKNTNSRRNPWTRVCRNSQPFLLQYLGITSYRNCKPYYRVLQSAGQSQNKQEEKSNEGKARNTVMSAVLHLYYTA